MSIGPINVDPDFRTPDWAKDAVLYQIFPDRFRRSDKNRVLDGLAYHHAAGRSELILHERWDEQPEYLPREGKEHYVPTDLFGGDIPGITLELPRLAKLGVTLIYLNPIFEALSNHRYNTGDYLKIDPCLGTDEDFDEMIRTADELGIKIILDGVFSHTGDDSVYFNKYGRYDSSGAYRSVDSPYYSWYDFYNWPDDYRSWWGFTSLPEVDERNPQWIDFIIEGSGSVINKWLGRGVSGFRLDVADELPDETIERIRTVMKRRDPDSFLIGEVWDDATSKYSYGQLRKYAHGRELDSVMNYPFADHTASFLSGGISGFAYRDFLAYQRDRYPREMYYALMNMLSSHDAARVRTRLTGIDVKSLSREEQAAFEPTPQQACQSAAMHRLAVAIQFSLPGIPSVYYGDEYSMTGLLDPFNRAPLQKTRDDIYELHEQLAAFRREHICMRTGYASFHAAACGVVAILRYTKDGRDAIGRESEDECILTAVNPGDEPGRIVVDLAAVDGIPEIPGSGLADIEVAPRSFEIRILK
ncbi:MAG: glycoside hydrolase family 13 protein [Clostridiales Family XIII bacterium]|jgi:glycosidase|nr:glycoside hydrolase family 13 protein [Clostridiales Family XIII bacterium]